MYSKIYPRPEVDYPEVTKREWFIKGIERLLKIANEQTTAILCSEEDPAKYHRHHLIAKYIIADHPEINVQHIRGDGIVLGAGSIRVSLNKPSAEQLTFFHEERNFPQTFQRCL